MNNESLYDAAIAGATGCQDRWLTAVGTNAYDDDIDAIKLLAAAIDNHIPTIEGGASISQINLLQSIVQAVVTGRSLTGLVSSSHAAIATSIAALWSEAEMTLFNEPVVGEGGNGDTNTFYATIEYDPGMLSAGPIIQRFTTALIGLQAQLPVVISPRYNSSFTNQIGVVNASCPQDDVLEIHFIHLGTDTISPGSHTYDVGQITGPNPGS
jgi:hypothetical protein